MDTKQKIELLVKIYQSLSTLYDAILAKKYNYDEKQSTTLFQQLLTVGRDRYNAADLKLLNKVWNAYKQLSTSDIRNNQYELSTSYLINDGIDALKQLKEYDNN